MTQHELVIEYIKKYGSILPAKMAGILFMGHMFGSETSKRCRELRKLGKLLSQKEGKFERFALSANIPQQSRYQQIKVEGIEKLVTVKI